MWSVPNLWPGQTVAILASGPSMSQSVADQVHQGGIAAIAINTTFRLAPWADMLYAADTEWWGHASNRDAHQFAGLKVCCQQVQGVHRLADSGRDGFDPDPRAVRTGSNSGYQAIHIAMHAGASRILLLGLDMHGGHWHGAHPQGLRSTTQEQYAQWAKRFEGLVPAAKERGIDIVNCTPGSAVKCFRFAELAMELKECVER